IDQYSARELMDLIAEGTRICGDPGLQYHDNINRWLFSVINSSG
ncbi:unnamed protein product, partial [marine sediment metagenome]